MSFVRPGALGEAAAAEAEAPSPATRSTLGQALVLAGTHKWEVVDDSTDAMAMYAHRYTHAI